MTDVTRSSWARPPKRAITVGAFLASVLAASATLAAAGATANVKGKITGWEKLLPQVYLDATKSDSRRYTWREPSPTVKQEFRRLSANVSRDVCIAAFSAAAAPAHEPIAIKVTGGRLTPATIVLSPGSRLSFKNVDPFPHVLYEAGNDKWAANAMGPGSTREWAAMTPGLHVIRDELFPSVVMSIVVDPTVAEFALPDHEGSFSMPLAPGDYTLRAFFDGKPSGREMAVHVGPGGFEMKEPMIVGNGDSK